MQFAMVFPGQGSQSLGMLQAYGDLPEIRATFELASTTLGQDLWDLATNGPESELGRTVNTQPLMLTAGVAVYRAWLRLGGRAPAVLAGHSLGEYTALVAADALDFPDAVRLVRFRAQAMQEAVPEGVGAMAAILGLDVAPLREACVEAAQGEVVEPVNFNAPGQIVIAGHLGAVLRAMELAKAKGAKRAIQLPVSAPFHSSLMKPAAVRMADRLASVPLHPPKIGVVHNFDVAMHTEPDAIRQALIAQVDHPVRWVETIETIAQMRISTILECGPGKVLAPMIKRIAAGTMGVALADAAALTAAVEESL